jgi:hypothetical protein
MIELKISFDFADGIGVRLSWSEVLEGFDRKILTNDFPIHQAKASLDIASSDDHLKIAISEPGEPIRCLVEKLAKEDKALPNLSKILYLLLAYIDSCVVANQEKLDLLEDVYCDFDHPNEMSGFIRYMPMIGPDLGSKDANEARMIERFKSYLNDEAKRFSLLDIHDEEG